MIGYFPNPYENELFYSILARYHSHSSNRHGNETLKELTGKIMKTSLEYPIGLEHLVEKLKIFSPKYNKKYFYDHHTNIPVINRPSKWKDEIDCKTNTIHNLFGVKLMM